MTKSARPRGLGRGLDALLPLNPSQPASNGASSKATLFMCGIEKLVPCRAQPRQYFDAAALDELTASIQLHGLLEPLVVRRLPQPLPGTGAIADYAEMGNFGMRVVMSYQPNTLAQQFTVDVLYGAAVIRNGFGVQVNS